MPEECGKFWTTNFQSAKKGMSRLRNFVFTINNPTEDDEKLLGGFECSYLIYGREVGENNTPHFQGYCEMKTAKSMKTLKKSFPRAHIEKRRGTAQQAAVYCKKDGDFTERGEISQQGKRNDIISLRDEIKANPRITTSELVERLPESLARFPRFVATVRSVYFRPETLDWKEPPNVWLFGSAGCGKTSTAYGMCERPPYDKLLNKWWDDYDMEDDVLIDDLHPDGAKYIVTHLKRWADRYPFRAEVKGATIYIRPLRIIVTTQYTMLELFPNQQDIDAIERRFTQIIPAPYIEEKREDAVQEELPEEEESPPPTYQEAVSEEKKDDQADEAVHDGQPDPREI